MTLTFEPAKWFLFATHYLVLTIICDKLFINPTMQDRVMTQTQTGFTEAYEQSLSAVCDLDLATWFLFATQPRHHDHLCQTILKSHYAWHRGQTGTGITEGYAQSLSANCDFDIWPTTMILIHDTSSCHNDYLCQIIFKSHHAWQSYGLDTNSSTEAYEKSLRVDCDLDLWFLTATHCLVMMIICAI